MLPVRLAQRSRRDVARSKLTLSQEVAMRQRSDDSDLNAQEMVLVNSIMGDAAHRLPWAMPSQQERMLLKALARPSRGNSGPASAVSPREGPVPIVPDSLHSTQRLYPSLDIPDAHSSQASTGAPPRRRSATFHVQSTAPTLHPDVSAEASPASRRSSRVHVPHMLVHVAEEDDDAAVPASPASRRSRSSREDGRSSHANTSEQPTDGFDSSDLANRYEDDNSTTSEGSYLMEGDSSEGEMEYPTPLNPGFSRRRFGHDTEAQAPPPARPPGELRQRRGYHHSSTRSRDMTRPSYDTMRTNVMAMSQAERDALRQMLNDEQASPPPPPRA